MGGTALNGKSGEGSHNQHSPQAALLTPSMGLLPRLWGTEPSTHPSIQQGRPAHLDTCGLVLPQGDHTLFIQDRNTVTTQRILLAEGSSQRLWKGTLS